MAKNAQAVHQTITPDKSSAAPNGLLQRKCACGGTPGPSGECSACRAKRLGLQRAATTTTGTRQGVPPIVHEVLRSPGQPLAPSIRSSMQPRFGYNFNHVRVHTDARAAESAQAVKALAYTVGRDVVFGAGQYAPETSTGRRLLAHELTHVVQQGLGGRSSSGRLEIVHAQDTSEHQAQKVEENLSSTHLFNISEHGASRLARQPEDESESLGDATSTSAESEETSTGSAATSIEAQPLDVDAGAPTARPCPTSVSIGAVSQFNHSNLSSSDQQQFRTYLGAVSRMDVGPGPDHSGHCMKERLTTVSNNCPAAVYQRGGRTVSPCTGNFCLGINHGGSRGDGRTHTSLADGPTSFIDLHRTFHASSLLEGTGVNTCSVVCEQTYTCDRTGATTGTFRITRNYQAGTLASGDSGTVHITTGTVTKTTPSLAPRPPQPRP